MIELLAPAGNYEKMITAFSFGADAVYLAGKNFGLRAFAGNFENDELKTAVEFAHKNKKKIYITLNILAKENDFDQLYDYVNFLNEIHVDAVIVSDLGIIAFIRENFPSMEVHVSTQANILNSYSINYLAKLGVKRIILAREVKIEDIRLIRSRIPKDIELECFVHGAMCVSYSGRCLISNYFTGRDANRGECVQACRWKYCLSKFDRKDVKLEIEEDEKGTYILNSKDLNLIKHLKELKEAGINSFKIEGRMKSSYYVANVVNAYRRAIDANFDEKVTNELFQELNKSSHREYTTGFCFNDDYKQNISDSMPVQTHEFMAVVLKNTENGETIIEQRNKFLVGDELEVLSNGSNFNKKIIVSKLFNLNKESVDSAKNVQEKLILITNKQIKLRAGEILRKKV